MGTTAPRARRRPAPWTVPSVNPRQPSKQSLFGIVTALLCALAATGNLFLPSTSISISALAIYTVGVLAFFAWLTARLRLELSDLLIIGTLVAFIPAFSLMSDLEYSQDKVLQTVFTLGISWACTRLLTSTARLDAFIKFIVAGGAFTAAMLLVLGETHTFPGRTSYMTLNPIPLGRMVSYAALVLLVVGLASRGLYRLLWLATGAGLLATAALTGSRGPLLAAVLAILFITICRRGTMLARIGATTLVVITLVATLFIARSESSGVERLSLSNFTGRAELWGVSLESFAINPLGIGLGNLREAFPAGSMSTPNVYSHNFFLEAAVEGGVILLLWLLFLLATATKKALGADDTTQSQILAALFFAALINAQFSSDFIGNRFLWVMTLLIIATNSGNAARDRPQPVDAVAAQPRLNHR